VPLYTRDGRSFRVVYPGRPADGPGPDFRDAILSAVDGTRVRGDVEIHVRASGWPAHGHHSDPRYNGVVFHVTADASAGADVRTESGLRIPLLPLSPVLRKTAGPARSRSPRVLPDLTLAEAGDRRFLAKSAGLTLEMERAGPDQALYAAVLECLGYSRNRGAFRRLAARLQWAALSSFVRLHPPYGDAAAAALLWAGGFGEKPADGPRPAGRAPRWAAASGRPDNAPRTRVCGAAALAARFVAAGGPLEAIAAAVNQAQVAGDVAAAFVAGPPPGEARALVGPGRASQISVNAALPGVHAWASLNGNAVLGERCLRLYRAHPKLPENSVTREVRRLLSADGRRPNVPGAREQQGLIYLYRALSPAVG